MLTGEIDVVYEPTLAARVRPMATKHKASSHSPRKTNLHAKARDTDSISRVGQAGMIRTLQSPRPTTAIILMMLILPT